ncbi:hypothetical protein BDZ89DRAFT_1161745 [Hymenopellis radicata]|nr:hypothetical protein BDZ89DRAFT_1161745 [Hymenopellis radicata]
MDEALGSDWDFNEEIYSVLANSNPGSDNYNASSAGTVQHERLQQSLEDNNQTHDTLSEMLIQTRESALYLSVMGNATTGEAPKKFVDVFFRDSNDVVISEIWAPELKEEREDKMRRRADTVAAHSTAG